MAASASGADDKRGDILSPAQVMDIKKVVSKEKAISLYLDARMAINETLKTKTPNDLGIWTVTYRGHKDVNMGAEIHMKALMLVAQELKKCGWVLLNSGYSPDNDKMTIEFQEDQTQKPQQRQTM